MAKKVKKNPATVGLNSPEVEGQGTTQVETGAVEKDSSRRKNRKKSGLL